MASLSNDHLLVSLVALGGVIALFSQLFLRTRGRPEYIPRLRTAVILAISIGLAAGIIKALDFIVPNQYLRYEMHHLTLRSLVSIVDKYLLSTLGAALFFFAMLSLLRVFFGFIGAPRRISDRIIAGVVPAPLVFTIGGYWINKLYLPAFLDVESIAANAIWTLVCALLVWVFGLLIFKISHKKIESPERIFDPRILVGVAVLAILLNVAYLISFHSFPSDRRNLILISIDTLRADHLSCYGYNRNTSPNIDRFAADGVLFANTIAQSSWTLPSHMSMLTGLYSSSHGVILDDRGLNDEHVTLAELLQNAGYRTVAFTDGGYLSAKYGHQGFDRFDGNPLSCKDDCIQPIYTKAVDWLRNNSHTPFFLFLHTYQVHAPFDPPPAYDVYSDKDYSGIAEVSGNTNAYYEKIKSKMTSGDRLYVIDKYDGEISYTDHFLGKLFDELRALGLYDKSIIVLTSDHGENFLDHTDYAIDHVELYDEIVKVPLIVKAPPFPGDKVIEAQVESIDIMPTALEVLGVPIPNVIDGKSLVKLVKKESYDDRDFAFSEKSFYPNHSYDRYGMIRNKDWKLLLKLRQDSGKPNLELYNLSIDPEEQDNLFTEETEIGKSLVVELQNWMDSQEEKYSLLSVDRIKLDDKLKEQLKALGYIN